MATPIPENRAEVTTSQVLASTEGSLVHGDACGVHVGITSDSRAVKRGGVFLALRGEHVDGHVFAPAAASAGASLIVVERGRAAQIAGDATVIEVDDSLVAWGAIARDHLLRWRDSPGAEGRQVVAITGTAGKTTTKELCASLLSLVGDVHATPGNLNNRIGVPAVVFGLEARHRFAVVEMGMSVPGEIAALASIAPPDVAILTNVGLAHAERVGGRAAVAHEKGELFAALGEPGAAIVNVDDDAILAEVHRTRARRVIGFGRHAAATYVLVARTPRGFRGSHVVLMRRADGRTVEIDLPLVGEHAVVDWVAALAAAEAAASTIFTDDLLARAVRDRNTPPGRSVVRPLRDGTVIIDDTYNANPDSMRAALASLGEIVVTEKRRAVAVLGEMKELGALSSEEHTKLGLDVARARVALAIGCGGLIDLTLDRAAREGVAVRKGRSVDDAASIARAEVRPGDVVLVKGSRSVGTERVVDALEARTGAA